MSQQNDQPLTTHFKAPNDAVAEDLLRQILEELKVKNNESKLWDVATIAKYFNVGKSTCYVKIITAVGFPRPITVQGTMPRWKPDEVKEWASRQRST